ncbi:hypothetical protein EJB05_56182, partial [Eragrostis curvula]
MMRSSGGSWLASTSPTMCSAQHPPIAALQEDRGKGIQQQDQGDILLDGGIQQGGLLLLQRLNLATLPRIMYRNGPL